MEASQIASLVQDEIRKARTQFKLDPLSKMLFIYGLCQIVFFSLSNRLAARYVYQSFIILGFLFAFHTYDFFPKLQKPELCPEFYGAGQCSGRKIRPAFYRY